LKFVFESTEEIWSSKWLVYTLDCTYSLLSTSVSAKNVSGDATNFKSTVSIKVDLVMNNKLKNNFIIRESFNYNNDSNKFSLKTYEKNIKNNLTETITEKLIFRLSNIK
jgi:hypothetical protein